MVCIIALSSGLLAQRLWFISGQKHFGGSVRVLTSTSVNMVASLRKTPSRARLAVTPWCQVSPRVCCAFLSVALFAERELANIRYKSTSTGGTETPMRDKNEGEYKGGGGHAEIEVLQIVPEGSSFEDIYIYY